MALLITCPACVAKLKVPDHLAGTGKLLKCPRCQEKIPLHATKAKPPDDGGDDAAAPEPEPKSITASAAPRKRSREEEPGPPERKHEADQDEPAPEKRKRSPAAAQDSTLLGGESWMLRKKEGFLHRLYPYRCEFFRPGGKEIVGVVEEKCNRLFKALFGGTPLIGRLLPIHLQVRDGDDQPLLFTVRVPGLRLFRFSLATLLGLKEKEIEVLEASGEFVCSFVMKLFSLTPNFTVYGPDQNKIGEFRFKLPDLRKGQAPRMCLRSAAGEEWGTVMGEHEAEAMKMLKEGQKTKVTVRILPAKAGLVITVNPEFANETMAKQLLLSAAVAMRIFGVYKIFLQN
jgi:hypothetical protein